MGSLSISHDGSLDGASRLAFEKSVEPWRDLGIDAILVPFGRKGLGNLGTEFVERELTPRSIRLPTDVPDAERPVVVHLEQLAPPDSDLFDGSLRKIVLVSSRSSEAPNRLAVRTAAHMGVVAAFQAGADHVGVPVIATGANSLEVFEVAEELCGGVLAALTDPIGRGRRATIFHPMQDVVDELEHVAREIAEGRSRRDDDIRVLLPFVPAVRYALEVSNSDELGIVGLFLTLWANDDPDDAIPLQLRQRIGEGVGDVTNRLVLATGADEPIRDIGSSSIARRALHIAVRVDAEAVHTRHLMAAILVDDRSAPIATAIGFDAEGAKQILREAVFAAGVDDDPTEWDLVLSDTDDELIGGFASDQVARSSTVPAVDALGHDTYVTMLSTLIARRDTPMPLSIGLFGPWGSGKSTFMSLMEAEVARLGKSTSSDYLTKVEHVWFNAWHYSDTNLWASIASTLFGHLARKDSSDELRNQLAKQLDEKFGRVAELNAASAAAESAVVSLEGRIVGQASEIKASARNVVRAILNDEHLKPPFEKAWSQLGLDHAHEQAESLVAAAEGATTDLVKLRLLWTGNHHRSWLAVGAVLAAAGAALAAGWADHWIKRVGTMAALFAAEVGIVTHALLRARKGAKLLADSVDGIRRRAQEQADDALAKEYAELRKATVHRDALINQRADALAEVGRIEGALADLEPGRRWERFVHDRADSTDYRARLGLVTTLRRDFEEFVTLMKGWDGELAEGDDARPVDRIVLYIDDLDRCTSDQVMEVLQAVHLLLAFDLFVVVVGVDPRWLLQSLRAEHPDAFSKSGLASMGAAELARPEDYLAKIFNVPFMLPSMRPDTFKRLIHHIAGDEPSPRSTLHAAESANAAEPSTTPNDGIDANASAAGSDQTSIDVQAGSELALNTAGRPVRIRPITQGELNMISSLSPLISSPRDAKRFVNVYRSLRSTRNLSRAGSTFVRHDGSGGEFQAVVVLLGILAYDAKMFGDLLYAPAAPDTDGGLFAIDRPMTWQEFVQALKPTSTLPGATEQAWSHTLGPITDGRVERQWVHLVDGLCSVSEAVTLPDLTPFRAWAPHVARFSFTPSSWPG